MIVNKIIGYTLLSVGLLVIGYALFQSYQIFTDKISAPMIFKLQPSQQKSKSVSQFDVQQQLDQAIQKQIGDLLPPEILPKLLNLISWSIFAGILTFGGGQIARIGIKLISN